LVDRASAARTLLSPCRLCPRACGVDRADGERGYCGLDHNAYWFRELCHYGIEIELIPSHAVYLAGCNMRCVFCTAAGPNQSPTQARPWDVPTLQEAMRRRRDEGAANLHFVGGEPLLSLHAILDLLAAAQDERPVIWDTNMYCSAAARELLDGVVDVYVADLKFGNDRCAQQVADAPDYLQTVLPGLCFAEDSARLIVRHLVLPGHFDCCLRPVLRMIRSELRAPRLALHGEYIPPRCSPQDPRLARDLPAEEFQRAVDLARDMDIELVE